MQIKRFGVAAICVAGIIGMSGPAFAGEYSGSGKVITRGSSHSACSFSGLDQPDTGANPEDHYGHPGDDADWAGTPAKGRVQSYGQIVAAGAKDFAPSPGEACRGNVTFEE